MSEAIRWFEKAAEQNDPDALFNLGLLYYSGKGVRRDWAKARELLERAVEADKHGWTNGAGDKARKCLQEMNANG
ncbi:MAG: sel1 repeat family protein [Kiritimatiellae bacterium]|nr:sel1 repeat family protein [Kiritimatiellia bacterium]